MTRWELIVSDEYIQANLDSILTSRRPVKEARAEAAQFVRCLVDELLEGDQSKRTNATLQAVIDELELLSPPGAHIEEELEAKGIHKLEFAFAMSRLPNEVEDIFTGKIPMTPILASQLEQVLGIDAQLWLNLEAIYQEKLAKIKAQLNML